MAVYDLAKLSAKLKGLPPVISIGSAKESEGFIQI
jgi:hypothetical protein